MGEFEDAVTDQILRLRKAWADHLGVIPEIINLNSTVIGNMQTTCSNDLGQIQPPLPLTATGLTKANQIGLAYVEFAEKTLASLQPTTAADQQRLDDVNRKLQLLSDNVDLGVLLLENTNGSVTVTPPPSLTPPGNQDTTDSIAFLAYLDSQVQAAQALSPHDKQLHKNFLDTLTTAWEQAITNGFTNDIRSREVQVAESCIFQDRLDQTIGIINELIGDRDLLDPAIL